MTASDTSVLVERRGALAVVSAETLEVSDYVEIESARHLHTMAGSIGIIT
jgi:hypothetical protein